MSPRAPCAATALPSLLLELEPMQGGYRVFGVGSEGKGELSSSLATLKDPLVRHREVVPCLPTIVMLLVSLHETLVWISQYYLLGIFNWKTSGQQIFDNYPNSNPNLEPKLFFLAGSDKGTCLLKHYTGIGLDELSTLCWLAMPFADLFQSMGFSEAN